MNVMPPMAIGEAEAIGESVRVTDQTPEKRSATAAWPSWTSWTSWTMDA